jgi:molecular chaperone DnaJ
MGSGARFTSGGNGQPGGFEDVFGGMFGGGGGNRRAGAGPSGFGQGGFEDLLGGMFGGGGFGQTTGGYRGYGGPTRGRDLEASTTLDFITAIKGDTITLQPQGGKSIRVKIPAGVHDGQKIRLAGKGEPSPDGGETGNLVLTVSVRKHPVFERDGLNLRVDVPVTFVEATLGATVEVPTLGGDPVRLRVAAGTPSGRVLRVKGRGVTTGKGTGDLLATVQVAVPSHLSEAAKKHLEAFAKAMPEENPRTELLEKAAG